MKALILGSTGMVGSEVLKECLANPLFKHTTIVNREPSQIHDKKIKEIIHDDFSDFSKIKKQLKNHDVIFYCIGVYTGAVPEKVFIEVTYDYFVAFAKTAENKNTIFCLFSAAGANPTSAVMFGKWKGKAEEALRGMQFKKKYFFRPGYIHPSNKAKMHKNLLYKTCYYLFPILNTFFPKHCTTAAALAKAMVYCATHPVENSNIDNSAIRAFAKK